MNLPAAVSLKLKSIQASGRGFEKLISGIQKTNIRGAIFNRKFLI